ncbi:MAG: DivIVA domain-containing protein [Actinomycetota bacterium]|nr:DivIVA domain-containing protein [Actinomycetota bacterium]
MEPQEVAGKEFLVGMRGYVREDVRVYLRAVAEELFRRDEVISTLRHKLDKVTRQLEEANGQRDVDRATLVKLVGEEASAILSSADGAAERIRFEAERYAEAVREGLVSTTDHLAGLYENLGQLLAELQAKEQQGRRRPEPSRSDVVLLGPGDDYPFGGPEIRLDETPPSVSSGRPAVRDDVEGGGDLVE